MKPFRIILCILFAAIICFPFGTMIFFLGETKAEYEQFTMAKPLSVEDVFEGGAQDFTKNVDKYLNQHVSKRQPVISLWAQMLYNIDVCANDDVVMGKDKMLYLSSTIDDRRVAQAIDMDKIKTEVDNVQSIKDYCSSKGIDFVFAIAPNKVTIYPERLPDWYSENGPDRSPRSVYTNV